MIASDQVPILEIKGLRKNYGSTVALREVNLTARRGELIVILGRSGAGKSTLMRCINRLVTPTDGEIRFNGVPVSGNKKALRAYRRKIGMIFQHFNLVRRLPVLENVLTGMLGYKSTLPSIFKAFSRDEKLRAIE